MKHVNQISECNVDTRPCDTCRLEMDKCRWCDNHYITGWKVCKRHNRKSFERHFEVVA